MEKIVLIKQRIQAAQDRQKSYADLKWKPMEFEVRDRVMLKVSPWKGVVRFSKRGESLSIYINFTFNSQQEMDQKNLTLAQIPILDTGKFEQWQFQIQQYLQHKHYVLWEVIEFGDSYKVPASVTTTETTSDGTGKKSGRTFTLTAEDMQKRKNDVKARTTLLMSLPDENQLRFTKHSRGNEDVNTASVSTASTNVCTASANIGVASISQDTACAYIASQSNGSQIKFKDKNQIDGDDMEEMDIKWNMALLSMRADKF
nr:putative reverse transcriptase domain-containing protein [Tanacetum cinerariifolium]